MPAAAGRPARRLGAAEGHEALEAARAAAGIEGHQSGLVRWEGLAGGVQQLLDDRAQGECGEEGRARRR